MPLEGITIGICRNVVTVYGNTTVNHVCLICINENIIIRKIIMHACQPAPPKQLFCTTRDIIVDLLPCQRLQPTVFQMLELVDEARTFVPDLYRDSLYLSIKKDSYRNRRTDMKEVKFLCNKKKYKNNRKQNYLGLDISLNEVNAMNSAPPNCGSKTHVGGRRGQVKRTCTHCITCVPCPTEKKISSTHLPLLLARDEV